MIDDRGEEEDGEEIGNQRECPKRRERNTQFRQSSRNNVLHWWVESRKKSVLAVPHFISFFAIICWFHGQSNNIIKF